MRAVETKERYLNKLAGSRSPYLRRHARNPVFWEPWGEEAFARARAENKPIFLSIGYSTCYWCHAMEREVFENPSIAALMNERFVNVKVDREEMPDVDDIYMIARQITAKEGGWPNNLFLTPDLDVIYAGGAFGAKEAFGKPGFPQILDWIDHHWQTDEAKIRADAKKIMGFVQGMLTPEARNTHAAGEAGALAHALTQHLARVHDRQAGGFFRAPKFPHENYLLFLMAAYSFTRDPEPLSIAEHSLLSMAAGGIHDHVGGGFHRYAVDKDWYVPHFEKMLYTQALCARSFTELYRLTANEYAADLAKETLAFTTSILAAPDGAFYSAVDAQTDGVEGAYYAWSGEQLQQALSPEQQQFFAQYYGLADIPAMPGHPRPGGMALIARAPLSVAAFNDRRPYMMLSALAGQVLNTLATVRATRKPPRIDDKIIVAWNGLMIEALARASALFGEESFYRRAEEAANFLLNHAFDHEDVLMRLADSEPGGPFIPPATLEDYSYFIQGLLMLHRVKKERLYLDSAYRLIGQADGLLRDGRGAYFFSREQEGVPLRAKTAEDTALPSPNAVMLHNFLDLHELTGERHWLEDAESLYNALVSLTEEDALPEYATLLHGGLRLYSHRHAIPEATPPVSQAGQPALSFRAQLQETEGDEARLNVEIAIPEGWHIYAPDVVEPMIPTLIDINGPRVAEVISREFPQPEAKIMAFSGDTLPVHTGTLRVPCRIRLVKGKENLPIYITLQCQPCREDGCARPVHEMITI